MTAHSDLRPNTCSDSCSDLRPNSHADPRLVAEGIALSWDGQPICANISLSIAPGEIVCLVGRSGTGKTTLFHALAGLTTPDAGRVLLDGQDITGQPGHVSYMLQKDLLMREHTILDNVALPLVVGGMRKRQARRVASEHLAEFGLEGVGAHYPAQLSGGMRQRAALLRTYLMQKDLVLLDEPFSALDALTRADMQQWFLQKLTAFNLSALLITHSVDEAIAMADRVLVLTGAPAQGTPSTIVGQVSIPALREERARFALQPEALEIKREILQLLG